MRVMQHAPVTWRDRTFTALVADMDLRGRAQRLYHQMTDGVGLFARLRHLSPAVLTRLHKGRSAATQSPSAIERSLEELTALAAAGQPAHVLYIPSVMMRHVADDLCGSGIPTEPEVLAAIAISDDIEAAEQRAETALLTRADRVLTDAALAELEERTLLSIAADTRKAALVARLRRQRRHARPRGVAAGRIA